MARGKIQMKRIENMVHRQVTFCKRRAGLLKKAKELSILCDADIGVIIFSNHGKLYELSTKGSMQDMVDRYMSSGKGAQVSDEEAGQQMDSAVEIARLKQEIQFLQKGLRYTFGGGSGSMNLDELDLLEKHLELWIQNIRSTKMEIMFQEIQMLKNKEEILKATNACLQEEVLANPYKIEEERGVFFDIYPNITGIPYQLTIPNNIFNF